MRRGTLELLVLDDKDVEDVGEACMIEEKRYCIEEWDALGRVCRKLRMMSGSPAAVSRKSLTSYT